MLGWPFLVAPGRRRDHTTIVAPRILVEQLDYGVLEEQASPGPPRTVQARSARGRRLFIVYWTEPVPDVRDEHGRPLRMIYGIVSFDGPPSAAVDADRQAARDAVRPAYRAFLADEDGHAVVPSAPFPLHAPAALAAPGAAEPVAAPVGSARPRPFPVRLVAASAGAVLVVVFVVVAGVALLASRPSPAMDGPPAASPTPPSSPACVEVEPSASGTAAPSVPETAPSRIRFRRSPGSPGSPARPGPGRSPCPG
jgi:hypothetical protein